MYICICNSITEKDIENAIDSNPDDIFSSPDDVLKQYDKSFKCRICCKSVKAKMEKYYEQKNCN